MKIRDYLDMDSEKRARLKALTSFAPKRHLCTPTGKEGLSPFDRSIVESVLPRARRIWKEDVPYPVIAHIRISYACNHSCPGCRYAGQPAEGKAFFESDRFSDLVRALALLNLKFVDLSGGGEPTLHPEFEHFARSCIQNEFKVSLLTNASALQPKTTGLMIENFSCLRINLDASNDRVYHRIHHPPGSTEFQRILGNVERVVSERERKKSHLIIGADVRLGQANMNFMEEMAGLDQDLGLDYVQFRTKRHGPDRLLPEQAQRVRGLIQELSRAFHPFGVHGEMGDHQFGGGCWASPYQLALDLCGEVYACPHFSRSEQIASFGNILKQPADELWFGARHKRAVEFLKTRTCQVPGCRWRFKPDFLTSSD